MSKMISTPKNDAFFIEGHDRPGDWLITVDHASNVVPAWLGGTLGLPEEEMQRHIAWDIGAAGVASALGRMLDAPVIGSTFSRLVIDPNRGLQDPTLIMEISDGAAIPANRSLSEEARSERIRQLWLPYFEAQAQLLAENPERLLISIHSFTPSFRNRSERPWHIGLLSAQDRRLAEPMLSLLLQEEGLIVGDNEPYTGHLPGDSIDRLALSIGRANLLIELRQDLIGTMKEQRDWAERLAPMLEKARENAML